MDDLAAFYAARLDEAEATAHHSGPARVAWLTYLTDAGQMHYTTVAADDDYGPWIADGRELPEPASVSVIYDPAQALREVVAGRARLALLAEAMDEMDRLVADDTAGRTDQAMAIGRARAAATAVKHDAAVYNDHPSYKPEWAPG